MKQSILGVALETIAKGQHTFGGKISHFPGRLDDGLRAMGAWDHDGHAERPKTLYTGKPDIVHGSADLRFTHYRFGGAVARLLAPRGWPDIA
jgi:hypothetical protein